MAGGLQLADGVKLPGGRNSCTNLRNADFRGHGCRRAGVITRQQHGREPEGDETLYRIRAGGLDLVIEHDHAEHFAVGRNDDGGASGCFGRVDALLQTLRYRECPFGGEPGRSPDGDELIANRRAHPSPRIGRERVDRREVEAARGRFGDDGAGDRMFGPVLGTRREPQHLLLGESGGGHEHGRHGEFSARDGSGLIEHDRVDAAGLFEHLWAADENAEL